MAFGEASRPHSSPSYSAVSDDRENRQNPRASVFVAFLFHTKHCMQQFGTFLRPIFSKTSSRFEHITASWKRNTRFLKHDRWRAFSNCLIHIPPVAITVALIVLNTRNVFYEEVDTPRQSLRLNALQFAAKVHEIFITLSLSLVAISLVQFELLRGGGLPLDGVIAGFQISNPSSLWSRELWRKCFEQSFRIRRLRFIVVIFVLILLTATVGPSSAILMIPSIGWWSIPALLPPEGDYHRTWPSSYATPLATGLWPTNVTLENFLPPDCNFTIGSMPIHCPAAGLEVFQGGAGTVWSPDGFNFTVYQGLVSNGLNYERSVGSSSRGCELDVDCLWFWAQTTSVSAAAILISRSFINYAEVDEFSNAQWSLSLFNGSQPYAPHTFVYCNENQIGKSNETRSNYTGIELQFPLSGGQSWSMNAADLFNQRNFSDLSAALWVTLDTMSNNTPSIGAAFVGDSYENSSNINIIACSIYAGWSRAEMYLGGNLDPYVHSSAPFEFEDEEDSLEWTPSTLWPEHVDIDIDLEWANLALPPSNTILNLTTSFLSTLPEYGLGLDDTNLEQSFGMSLTLLITDALARLGSDVAIVGPGYQYASIPDNYTEVSFEGHRGSAAFKFTKSKYGYGYTLNTNTKILGAAVLLTHTLIALIHMILVIWFGWTCSNLDSIRDTMLTALKSPPPIAELDLSSEKSKQQMYTLKAQKDSEIELQILRDSSQYSASLIGDRQSMTTSSDILQPDRAKAVRVCYEGT